MKYAKYAFVVLTIALVMSATTQPAAAQQAFTGHFTLPAEAYFGPTLLPAGDYSIQANLDKTTSVREVVVRGDSVRTSILTSTIMTEPVSSQSRLEIQTINGVNVIRQLDAGLVGQSFRFGVSKKARTDVERASLSSPTYVNVPVSSGAF